MTLRYMLYVFQIPTVFNLCNINIDVYKKIPINLNSKKKQKNEGKGSLHIHTENLTWSDYYITVL
jgi:hypothetical protein